MLAKSETSSSKQSKKPAGHRPAGFFASLAFIARSSGSAWSKRGASVALARGSFFTAHVAEKTDWILFALSGKLCEAGSRCRGRRPRRPARSGRNQLPDFGAFAAHLVHCRGDLWSPAQTAPIFAHPSATPTGPVVGAIHESPAFFCRTETESAGEGLAPPGVPLSLSINFEANPHPNPPLFFI